MERAVTGLSFISFGQSLGFGPWAKSIYRRYHFFFQAEDGIRDLTVTGVQTCALPIIVDAPEATTDRPVTNVNVLGASQRWREQLQVLSGAATSTIPASNAKYIYPGTQIGRASCRERV